VLLGHELNKGFLVPNSCRANGNSISAEMIQDILITVRSTLVSALFSKIWPLFWTFWHCRIKTIYVHCRKNNIYLHFLPVSKDCTNELYIFQQCTYAFFWKWLKVIHEKKNQNQMDNKLFMYKKQRHPFLYLEASSLETCRGTIFLINTNHNSEQRIIVL